MSPSRSLTPLRFSARPEKRAPEDAVLRTVSSSSFELPPTPESSKSSSPSAALVSSIENERSVGRAYGLGRDLRSPDHVRSGPGPSMAAALASTNLAQPLKSVSKTRVSPSAVPPEKMEIMWIMLDANPQMILDVILPKPGAILQAPASRAASRAYAFHEILWRRRRVHRSAHVEPFASDPESRDHSHNEIQNTNVLTFNVGRLTQARLPSRPARRLLSWRSP